MTVDEARLADAVAHAEAHETPWSRDLVEQIGDGEFEPPPWNEILGPVYPRGGPAGLVLLGGETIAEWGDPDRADLTFSVAKSYLAVLAGIAVRDGLIRDIDDRLSEYALDNGYDTPQNSAITWRHLLQQTSEWEGALWGKPDLIDRNREIDGDNSRKGQHRDLQAPGTYWEYNDVRVNRLSLSLLQVFRHPLEDVLRNEVMTHLEATLGWDWYAYDNAVFEINGELMPSVPGGTHWGGGLRISARDQSLLGLLVQGGGAWEGRQILPPGWVEAMLTPCDIKPDYGFLWWLNTGGELFPGAPGTSVFAIGAGGNVIWVDGDQDLTVVARWLDPDHTSEFMAKIMTSI